VKPVTRARLNVALDHAARALFGVSTLAQRTILRTLAHEAIRIAQLDAAEPAASASGPRGALTAEAEGAFDPDQTPVRWPRRR